MPNNQKFCENKENLVISRILRMFEGLRKILFIIINLNEGMKLKGIKILN